MADIWRKVHEKHHIHAFIPRARALLEEAPPEHGVHDVMKLLHLLMKLHKRSRVLPLAAPPFLRLLPRLAPAPGARPVRVRYLDETHGVSE